jgi:cell filamentation protein
MRAGKLDPVKISANVLAALEALQNVQRVSYQDVLDVHRTLFGSVYPWAGQDRLAPAPDIAVGKAGHFDLFAHPRDIKRAVENGLDLAPNPVAMRDRPGEVFRLLAYGHPVLEGNGRMLMTVRECRPQCARSTDGAATASYPVRLRNVSSPIQCRSKTRSSAI